MGDTWGISGPTFLWFYLLLALLAVGGAIVWRRQFTVGPDDGHAAQLSPTDLAFINGDRQLAVYSALAALRTSGAITGHGGYLTQSGPLPQGAPELDRAVWSAASSRVAQSSVAHRPGVKHVLDGVERRLVDAGWVLDEAGRRRVRKGSLFVFALLGLGVLRVFAGMANDRPVGYLLLMLLPLLVVALLLLTVPRQTAAARRHLRRTRAQSRHLSPSMAPAWATYGAAGAALGVALYGGAALWAADPAFAQEAEIQRQHASGYAGGGGGGDGGSSSGGDGGGGGGGCGGGGCGG